MIHYFAADGNYGDAAGFIVLPTDKFTDKDWLSISECYESDRQALALHIASKYSPMPTCCSHIYESACPCCNGECPDCGSED